LCTVRAAAAAVAEQKKIKFIFVITVSKIA